MQSKPKSVDSNQAGVHDNLEKIVRKHQQHAFLKPVAGFNHEAFIKAEQWLSQQNYQSIILDSCCGIGESSLKLARQNPDKVVIGIDQSEHRLDKHQRSIELDKPSNYLLVRAHIEDFWRLVLEAQWPVSEHCIFYPNPWPKSIHLKRRVHASPVFPDLIKIGGKIRLRSNWHLYLEEFKYALSLYDIHSDISQTSQTLTDDEIMTAFERKYHGAQQALWQLHCDLNQTAQAKQ